VRRLVIWCCGEDQRRPKAGLLGVLKKRRGDRRGDREQHAAKKGAQKRQKTGKNEKFYRGGTYLGVVGKKKAGN